MTCMNCSRRPPLSLMRAGHEIAMFCRMPPSFEAFCLNQVKGVSKAPGPARRHVIVGLFGAPDAIPFHLICYGHRDKPLKNATSLGVPNGPPSALVPFVAVDVDDERVIELPISSMVWNDAPDFAVVVGREGGKDFTCLM